MDKFLGISYICLFLLDVIDGRLESMGSEVVVVVVVYMPVMNQGDRLILIHNWVVAAGKVRGGGWKAMMEH